MGRSRAGINAALGQLRLYYQGSYARCERCGTYSATNAHSRKGFDPLTGDRWLPDTSDKDHKNYWLWFDVAWLCIPCHDKVEAMGHEKMYEEVHRLMHPRTGQEMYNLAKERKWI